jgi:hypothetical protein
MSKFDFKSEKPKNKRNFTFQEEKDFSMHNISARRTEGTIEQQRKRRLKNESAMPLKQSSALKKISAACKAAAKRKFKVWPSAYASGWGVRCTRAGGPSRFGGGKKKKK